MAIKLKDYRTEFPKAFLTFSSDLEGAAAIEELSAQSTKTAAVQEAAKRGFLNPRMDPVPAPPYGVGSDGNRPPETAEGLRTPIIGYQVDIVLASGVA